MHNPMYNPNEIGDKSCFAETVISSGGVCIHPAL